MQTAKPLLLVALAAFIWLMASCGRSSSQAAGSKSAPNAPAFKSLPEAFAALPPMPAIPQNEFNRLAQQSFISAYNQWTDDTKAWGDRLGGLDVVVDANFSNADEQRGHIDLTFDCPNGPIGHSFNVVAEVERKDSPENIAYWSKIKRGTIFKMSGQITRGFVFGPFDTKLTDWMQVERMDREDARSVSVWLDISNVTFLKVTVPSKQP